MPATTLRNLVAFAALLAATSCASYESGSRYINLVYYPGGERVKGIYKTNGSYDKSMMRRINTLFRDRTANEEEEIDPRLIDQINDLLSALALPEDTEVQLVSGFRDPQRNAELARTNKSVARESLHTKGQAADIRIEGISANAVAAVAKTMQGGGVSYYPKTNHIHVDTGAVRSWTAR
ncbi:MAG: YcbK family protein [Bdellovibrionales bacterium]